MCLSKTSVVFSSLEVNRRMQLIYIFLKMPKNSPCTALIFIRLKCDWIVCVCNENSVAPLFFLRIRKMLILILAYQPMVYWSIEINCVSIVLHGQRFWRFHTRENIFSLNFVRAMYVDSFETCFLFWQIQFSSSIDMKVRLALNCHRIVPRNYFGK